MNQPGDPNVTTDTPATPAVTPDASLTATFANPADPLGTTDHVRGSASTDGWLPGADAPGSDLPTVPGYRVLREIARGGMGRVLAAHDLSLDREVALKILLPGAKADRFVRESKITARLPHPGIPPVHALGTLADGSPFLAMKLIAGQTLADEIKTADRPRLLQAFTQVCQAVGFAHSRGFIHRDLKPANIMVGAFGEVQAMDWGLAKDLSGREISDEPPASEAQTVTLVGTDANETTDHLAPGESNDDRTQAGMVLGTPSYMAPEQARAEAVDARADVFALGGILCAILTGQAPFRGKSTKEVLQRARVADLAEAHARLDGCGADAELIALCRRCLSSSPADRPANGQAVADGLTSYLNGVQERLQTAERERAVAVAREAEQRKRRKVQLALAAALLVCMLAVLAVVARYAESERKRSLAEVAIRAALDQAEETQQGLHASLNQRGGVFALLDDPARWQAQIESARASLQRALALLESAEAGADPKLRDRAAQLDALLKEDNADHDLAVTLEQIRMDRSAWVNGSHNFAQAAEDYPRAFAKAGLVVLQGDPAVIAARLRASPIREQLVAALDDWATVATTVGQGQPAVPTALLQIGRLADPDPWGDRLRQPGLWRDRQALARLVQEAPARGLSAQALSLVEHLLEKDPPLREKWLRQARAQYPRDFWLNFDLAEALRHRPGEAAGFYRVAVTVRPMSGSALNNLGTVLLAQKQYGEALDCFKKAAEVNPGHAIAYANIGTVLADQHRTDEAIAAYRQAIELDPKFAAAYFNLGTVYNEKKQFGEAIAAYRKAVELDPKLAAAYSNLGLALAHQNQLPEAIAAYKKAIQLDFKPAATYGNLGNALLQQKQMGEAVAAFRMAVKLDPKSAAAYSNLGNSLFTQNQLVEAIAACKKAIELDPKLAVAYTNLGLALVKHQQPVEAIPVLRKAIKLDPKLAEAYASLGKALTDQKPPQPIEGIAAYKKAIELDPKRALVHYNLGIVLNRQRKFPEAAAAFKKVVELDPQDWEAYGNLAGALLRMGRFAEAAPAIQRAHELLPANNPRRPAFLNALKQCQQMEALSNRVPLVLEGKAPATPDELLHMTRICREYHQRPATAVRLFQAAFKAKPELEKNVAGQHRYHAATAAAQAGCGQGEDAGNLPAAEQARLRALALTWLRAELDVHARPRADGKPAVPNVEQRLARWQADADLACVREPQKLIHLPTEERTAWNALWADVAALLKKVEEKPK